MPTHTTYAVPSGMDLIAHARPTMLMASATRKTMVGTGRLNPSLSSSAAAHTASITPEKTKTSHATAVTLAASSPFRLRRASPVACSGSKACSRRDDNRLCQPCQVQDLPSPSGCEAADKGEVRCITVHSSCSVMYSTAMPTATMANPALMALIGERIRARRNARNWTLDELSERCGLSRRMLINVEQGVTNPSIATLLRIGDALGIALPSLVKPEEADLSHSVTRASARTALWTGANGGEAFMAAGLALPDTVELWDWNLGPGDAHASEPHVAGSRELLTVIDGEVTLAAGGEEIVLLPGDSVSFHGDTVHGYRNGGTAPARFALTVYEPAGVEGRR